MLNVRNTIKRKIAIGNTMYDDFNNDLIPFIVTMKHF